MTYPPNYGMPGPPPKPRGLTRTTRTLIIVAAVVTLLCCGGVAGGGFWIFRTVQTSTAPARDVVSGYLEDTRSGDYPAAYERLCERLRGEMTEEQFTRQWSAEPLGEYRITNTSVRTVNGTSTGEVTVSTGGDNRIFQVVKENGTWKVCS
ncbi:Rv0361 family membrane protein [Micromonospora rosaria]|uniref:Rv0361 family membrane protein n=1 Tax=Micromonospora rosaria TaxID=47874 RepID=UPI000AB4BFDF|nr:DUF4878 domain-containing protein [Micromonospora rosaria]